MSAVYRREVFTAALRTLLAQDGYSCRCVCDEAQFTRQLATQLGC